MVHTRPLMERDRSLSMMELVSSMMLYVSKRSWPGEVWPLMWCHSLTVVWLWMRSLMSLVKTVLLVNWESSLLVDEVMSVIVLVGVLSMVKLPVMGEVSAWKYVSLRLSSDHLPWLLLSSLSNILSSSNVFYLFIFSFIHQIADFTNMVNLGVSAVKSVVFIEILDSIFNLFLSSQFSINASLRFLVILSTWLVLNYTLARFNNSLNASNYDVGYWSSWIRHYITDTFVSWVCWYLSLWTSLLGFVIGERPGHAALF